MSNRRGELNPAREEGRGKKGMEDHFREGGRGLGITCFILILLLVFGSSGIAAARGAAGDDVLAIGTARVVKGNLAKAREKAVSEALEQGVEEYIIKRLGSQNVINNFQRIIHEIVPGAREGIENFHILAEEQKGEDYKILVRIRINERVLEEKLKGIGLVLTQGPSASVLFLVSQLGPEAQRILYWWKDPESDAPMTPTELALHRVFQERGFNPIRRLFNVPEGDYGADMRALDLQDEDAIEWGRRFDADLSIHGRCEIVGGEEIFLTLTAFDAKNGVRLHQERQRVKIDADAVGSEQLLQPIARIVNKAAAGLTPAVMGEFKAPEVEVAPLEISLRGIKNLRQFNELMSFLEQDVTGVESVRPRKVKGSVIELSVMFKGDPNALLERLSKQDILSFDMDLNRFGDKTIMIEVK
jgi:hypothetical protein